jgi:DNA-directed RNA polymerase subunit RPC12/RpoP
MSIEIVGVKYKSTECANCAIKLMYSKTDMITEFQAIDELGGYPRYIICPRCQSNIVVESSAKDNWASILYEVPV